jgi:hypothetical protein
MTIFYTYIGKVETISASKFLKQLKVRIIPVNRKNEIDNCTFHPSVKEQLVKENHYILVQDLLSKFQLCPCDDFETLPQGLNITTRKIFDKTNIKCRYLIKLQGNYYAPVSTDMFNLFLIEGSLFRKSSIEVITQKPEALLIFRTRGNND